MSVRYDVRDSNKAYVFLANMGTILFPIVDGGFQVLFAIKFLILFQFKCWSDLCTLAGPGLHKLLSRPNLPRTSQLLLLGNFISIN